MKNIKVIRRWIPDNEFPFNKNVIISRIVDTHNKKIEEDPSYNHTILNFSNEYGLIPPKFEELMYDRFLETASKHYEFEVDESRNSRKLWYYVTNSAHYKANLHDHVTTSTINSVYYLNVPTRSHGGLFVMTPEGEKNYIEVTSNDFILMPNYIMHLPMQSYAWQFRISVNMEIICTKDIWKNSETSFPIQAI